MGAGTAADPHGVELMDTASITVASMRMYRLLSCAVEASGCLVAPAVFKTDVAEYLGQAGSIPVRLRHQSDSR